MITLQVHIMQQGHTPTDAVFNSPDITPLLIFQIPVSHRGHNTFMKLACTNKSLQTIIDLRLSQADWVLYTQGCIVANNITTMEIDFEQQVCDWLQFFQDLEKFSSVEDVVQDMMDNLWKRFPEAMRLDEGVELRADFVDMATSRNIQCLMRVMEKYTSNVLIKSIGCAMLLKMYEYHDNLDDMYDHENMVKHARWAIDSASVRSESYELFSTNLRLLLNLFEATNFIDVDDNDTISCDMMSLVFKIQYKWHVNSDIMNLCHRLCELELACWEMPVPLTILSTPTPVDIITMYMVRHLDDNDYQTWGCIQLGDLSVTNDAAIVISQECMSRIARIIRVQHEGILAKTTTPNSDENNLYQQQDYMWRFLNAVVPLSDAAYQHFMSECDMELVLKSLDNILVLRDVVHDTAQDVDQEEITQICGLLLYICEKDEANVASFLENDGFEILVHALNFSFCHNSTLEKPATYSTVCLRLLHTVFRCKSSNAMAYVTKMQKNGTRTQKRFSFRFRRLVCKLQTFPVYLFDALRRYETMSAPNIDVYTHEDINYIVQLLKILVLDKGLDEILTVSQIQTIIISMKQIFLKINQNNHKLDHPRYHLGAQIGHMQTLCDCVASFDHLIERTLARNTSRAHQIAVNFFQGYMEVSNRFRPVDHDKRIPLH